MRLAATLKANRFGWAGNAIGLLALYPIYHVALFGRTRNPGSASVAISRDGRGVLISQAGPDPYAAYLMLAIYVLCPLALILGLIGLKKDHDRLVAGVAVLYGFALVWVMTIGTVRFYPVLAACTLCLAALHLYRSCKAA